MARGTIKWDVNADLQTLVCTVNGVGSFTFHADRAAQSNRAYATMHGFKQRIGDAAALGTFDEETGLKITDAQRFNAMKALADYYESGATTWSVRGPSVSKDDISLLIEALVRARPDKTREQCTEKVESLTRAQRIKFATLPEIAPFYTEVVAERTAGVDGEELLAAW